MLLIVSVVVLGIILFIFFRSIDTVFVPLIIIGIVVTWVFGTLALFGFKIHFTDRFIASNNCCNWNSKLCLHVKLLSLFY